MTIKIQAATRLKAASTDDQITEKGNENVKKLKAALAANGIALGNPQHKTSYLITKAPVDGADLKAAKALMTKVAKESGWKFQTGVKVPYDDTFFLEAANGAKSMASQATLNFKDMEANILPIGNW